MLWLYETSLITLALSLVIRLTVAPPCLNKGNLPPLRSSLLFCLGPELHFVLLVPRQGRGEAFASVSLALPPSHRSPFPDSRSVNIRGAHFSVSAFLSDASLVLRLHWCFAYPQATALPVLSLSDDLRNRELLPFNRSTYNPALKPAPRLR